MITIKMRDGKWILQLGDEIWQFENTSDFRTCLDELIIMKDTFGRLKNEP